MEYPQYPSRLHCLYVSKSVEESEKWADLFVSWGRPTYAIVKLLVEGSMFEGNAKLCFDATLDEEENLMLARWYWENQNTEEDDPIVELLADRQMKVIEIVKEINQNI